MFKIKVKDKLDWIIYDENVDTGLDEGHVILIKGKKGAYLVLKRLKLHSMGLQYVIKGMYPSSQSTILENGDKYRKI